MLCSWACLTARGSASGGRTTVFSRVWTTIRQSSYNTHITQQASALPVTVVPQVENEPCLWQTLQQGDECTTGDALWRTLHFFKAYFIQLFLSGSNWNFLHGTTNSVLNCRLLREISPLVTLSISLTLLYRFHFTLTHHSCSILAYFNFHDKMHQRTKLKIDHKRTFQRNVTSFVFAINVRNSCVVDSITTAFSTTVLAKPSNQMQKQCPIHAYSATFFGKWRRRTHYINSLSSFIQLP